MVETKDSAEFGTSDVKTHFYLEIEIQEDSSFVPSYALSLQNQDPFLTPT